MGDSKLRRFEEELPGDLESGLIRQPRVGNAHLGKATLERSSAHPCRTRNSVNAEVPHTDITPDQFPQRPNEVQFTQIRRRKAIAPRSTSDSDRRRQKRHGNVDGFEQAHGFPRRVRKRVGLVRSVEQARCGAHRPWRAMACCLDDISIQQPCGDHVDQSDAFGPEWMIGINVAPVVENVLAKWFR